MARIDDYVQAKELAKSSLSGEDPDSIAKYCGGVIRIDGEKTGSLLLTFLNQRIIVPWPTMDIFLKDSGDEVPVQQQVLILHYLQGSMTSQGMSATGEWISFQDVPDGRFYMGAFLKRAKDPLVKTFGPKPDRLTEVSSKAYNASPLDFGDFSVLVHAFPRVPVALVLWEGDDEFPPEGNILFDRSISHILSAEDIAWLAGMVIYPLTGMAKK